MVDQNISFRLIAHVTDLFPEMEHVKSLGLTNSADYQIFQFVRVHNFAAIMTLDEDFFNIQLEHGIPPKTDLVANR